jgi:pyruvate-formate lyase-activating enzyme
MNPALVDAVLKGLDLPTKTEHVDHQSVITLPLEYGGLGINMEYAADLRKFLLRDDIVILGGNDNDDHGHPDYNPAEAAFVPADMGHTMIARKDGDVWTIYTHTRGDRISFVFGKGKVAKFRPKTPFHIDLKITDYCDANCNFCYQGSSNKGTHADNLWGMLYDISKAKVFEVAIGGGEPTSHPEFLKILRYARDFGITPNFSTKNLSVSYEAIKLCGAFAYSATSAEEAMKAANAFGKTEKLVLQVVPGIMSSEELKDILYVASDHHIPVTLLGYKQVGRATTPSTTETGWIDVVRKVTEKRWLTLGIDTTLASRYEKELKGFDKRTFHVEEGLYSMYIDAVTGMCGPSSYQKDKLIEYNGDVENCFQFIRQTKGDAI